MSLHNFLFLLNHSFRLFSYLSFLNIFLFRFVNFCLSFLDSEFILDFLVSDFGDFVNLRLLDADLACQVLHALLIDLVPGFRKDLSRKHQARVRELLEYVWFLSQVVSKLLLQRFNLLHALYKLLVGFSSDLPSETNRLEHLVLDLLNRLHHSFGE